MERAWSAADRHEGTGSIGMVRQEQTGRSSRLKNVRRYTGRVRSRCDCCATPRVALTAASRTGAPIISLIVCTAPPSMAPETRIHRVMNSSVFSTFDKFRVGKPSAFPVLLPAATNILPCCIPLTGAVRTVSNTGNLCKQTQRLRIGSNCSSMDSIRLSVRRSISASPSWRCCSA